jgi:hypothetical protein
LLAPQARLEEGLEASPYEDSLPSDDAYFGGGAIFAETLLAPVTFVRTVLVQNSAFSGGELLHDQHMLAFL